MLEPISYATPQTRGVRNGRAWLWVCGTAVAMVAAVIVPKLVGRPSRVPPPARAAPVTPAPPNPGADDPRAPHG